MLSFMGGAGKTVVQNLATQGKTCVRCPGIYGDQFPFAAISFGENYFLVENFFFSIRVIS